VLNATHSILHASLKNIISLMCSQDPEIGQTTSVNALTRGQRRGPAESRWLGLRFRIPPGHGCLSLASVVCYQVKVSAKG
jgi:hypothetical protein